MNVQQTLTCLTQCGNQLDLVAGKPDPQGLQPFQAFYFSGLHCVSAVDVSDSHNIGHTAILLRGVERTTLMKVHQKDNITTVNKHSLNLLIQLLFILKKVCSHFKTLLNFVIGKRFSLERLTKQPTLTVCCAHILIIIIVPFSKNLYL